MTALLAQAVLGTLLCSPVANVYPAGTCVLSLETPLAEGNWLTFFSENHVIVAGTYPAGTKTLSIGPQPERIYLLQFYDGQQIKAVWEPDPVPCPVNSPQTTPDVAIQPVGEPLLLRALKAPLRLVKKLGKRK